MVTGLTEGHNHDVLANLSRNLQNTHFYRGTMAMIGDGGRCKVQGIWIQKAGTALSRKGSGFNRNTKRIGLQAMALALARKR